MRVQTTKALAKELQKYITEFQIEKVTLNEQQYVALCGDIWDAADYGDITYNKYGELVFNVWRISYGQECYACDNYINTKELTKVFKRAKAQTTQELATAVYNEYRI